MPKRSSKSQSKHDSKVKQVAKDLEKKGFDVKADIEGYKKPKTIGGYRPDVIGEKGKQKKIVEVETTESLGSARDQKQQKAFRDEAKSSKSTTFTQEVVKSGKDK